MQHTLCPHLLSNVSLQNLSHMFLSQFKLLQHLWTRTLQSLSRTCPKSSYPSSSCPNFCQLGLYNFSPELVPQVLIPILVAPTAWTGILLLAMTQGRLRKFKNCNFQMMTTWNNVFDSWMLMIKMFVQVGLSGELAGARDALKEFFVLWKMCVDSSSCSNVLELQLLNLSFCLSLSVSLSSELVPQVLIPVQVAPTFVN